MATQYPALTATARKFLLRQKIFFAATAAATGRVNVSPRGTDLLRVLADDHIIYLDKTGSGNETAAHLHQAPRLTLMTCSFTASPMILRVYGHGAIIARGTSNYAQLVESHYAGREPTGARQIVTLAIDLVQTSCGYGVPFFDYTGERDTLDQWADQKGEHGLASYRRHKNRRSIDGFPSGGSDDD